MSSYAAIADVSMELKDRLSAELIPDLVVGPEGVALCSPVEKGDAAVGIFLYDIQESDVVRPGGLIRVAEDRQQFPPMYLMLYYMVTVYPTGERRYRMGQEERILGKIAQYFHDSPVLGETEAPIQITLQNISTEDKLKLWNFPNEPYRVSLFYKATPVPVASARFREVRPVRERSIAVEQIERGKQIWKNGSR